MSDHKPMSAEELLNQLWTQDPNLSFRKALALLRTWQEQIEAAAFERAAKEIVPMPEYENDPYLAGVRDGLEQAADMVRALVSRKEEP